MVIFHLNKTGGMRLRSLNQFYEEMTLVFDTVGYSDGH